jgi:hypothetical protein
MKELLIDPEDFFNKRIKTDRRISSFKSILQSFYKGQRVRSRREEEREEDAEQGFYTDKYEKWMGVCAITIILLSAADAFFTLNIIKGGGTEENPFMLALLEINTQAFLVIKMAITTICVLFILVHSHFYVLKVIPVKAILKGILLIYTLLIGYELFLLSIIT